MVVWTPGRWVIGALVSQIWSVVGDKDRGDVNQTIVQPFVNYNLDNIPQAISAYERMLQIPSLEEQVRKQTVYTLAQLMTMEYFSTVESFEVSKEGDSDQTETSTSIAVTFSYKDNAVGTFFVVMKKEGGSWLIDMKSSVERGEVKSG